MLGLHKSEERAISSSPAVRKRVDNHTGGEERGGEENRKFFQQIYSVVDVFCSPTQTRGGKIVWIRGAQVWYD